MGRLIVKKCLLTLFAFITFFSFSFAFEKPQAQAHEVEVELLGKLGAMSTYIDKESLGDPEFNVSGGLMLTGLFRFDAGFGVGLNFNWQMSEQRLDVSKLTYALNAHNRWMTVQNPSFGFTFRYAPSDIFDLALWLNYGFGSVDVDMDIEANPVADAFGLANANLNWNQQTFEIGLMAAFVWPIPNIDLSVVIGLQLYADFSRMYADDRSLNEAIDLHGRYLDENEIYNVGFNVSFGLRYDFYLN